MTWTKPAWSGSPARSTSTEVLSWKTVSPVKSATVCSHQAVCSGRSLFRWAASRDSNRAMARACPSAVTPAVVPSQPAAPGASSDSHCWSRARSWSASETRPWISCTNIWSLDPSCRSRFCHVLVAHVLAALALRRQVHQRPVRLGPGRVRGGGGALHVELAQPLQPARQIPVAVTQHVHHGRDDHHPDQGRVDEQ